MNVDNLPHEILDFKVKKFSSHFDIQEHLLVAVFSSYLFCAYSASIC